MAEPAVIFDRLIMETPILFRLWIVAHSHPSLGSVYSRNASRHMNVIRIKRIAFIEPKVFHVINHPKTGGAGLLPKITIIITKWLQRLIFWWISISEAKWFTSTRRLM
jgi:hypothetical protein